MVYCIQKNKIPALINYLRSKYEVFAPQNKETDIVFDKITDSSDIVYQYEITILPAKKYFLPEEENLFTIENSAKNKKISAGEKIKPFVLFGLSLKDLEAIAYLDEIMNFKFKDDFYFNRRKKSILIAITERPVCSPFSGACAPFGGFATPSFGDLILEKIGKDLYAATAFSQAGKNLLKNRCFKRQNIAKILSKNTHLISEGELGKEKPNADGYLVLADLIKDSELLARSVEWSWKGYPAIWDELGRQCLGCGNCVYVCPLCYCFDIEDKIINQEKCVRCRKWDACVLPDFNLLAGGHSFHPTIKERYYNWFYHKFVRGYNEFGRSLCVACHRCQKFCPAGIDIEKVLNKIVKEYKKNSKF